ncbi:MAG: malate/lactate/ureidoglycolate dehydrogenase [Alphaproteobacteria bacterium]|nr:malate/lactate/ureidoglycolate dehydrogenase [Alphaproteobacteria bacterium]
MPTLTADAVYRLAERVAAGIGSGEDEAAEVADHLLRANLAGHDSHGIGMLPSYVRIAAQGLLVPNAELQTVADTGPLLLLDAARGFGQRMVAQGIRRAIERARQFGVCTMGLRNSAHVGRIGTYGEMCAEAGMAFTAFVNVADDPPWQAPWGCRDARLGTNPFCAAAPAAEGAPMLLDMATTTIAFGKVRVAHNSGAPVPEGAIIDGEGRPTTDPTALVGQHRGALVSFGRHKGSGLAVLCEALGAAVTGGQRADQPKRGGILNSLLATVIDVSRFGDLATIRQDVQTVATNIKGSRLAPGFDEILVPGEPERRMAAKRRAEGIPVDAGSWRQIREAALAVGVSEGELDAFERDAPRGAGAVA